VTNRTSSIPFVKEGEIGGSVFSEVGKAGGVDNPAQMVKGWTQLITVPGHVVESKYCDRRPVRQRQLPRLGGRCIDHMQPDSDRPPDVLQLLLTTINETGGQSSIEIVMNDSGHRDSPWLAGCLQSRRDVHSIAENVIAIDNNIP
jgi:hypothetical protein